MNITINFDAKNAAEILFKGRMGSELTQAESVIYSACVQQMNKFNLWDNVNKKVLELISSRKDIKNG